MTNKTIELPGTYATAIVYTDVVEPSAEGQIKALCDQPFAAGSKIRIMPDVHTGNGCTIGTTMTVDDFVVPNLVGVDIGCGMDVVRLEEKRINLPELDSFITKNIPHGRDVRERPHRSHGRIDIEELLCFKKVDTRRAKESLGTLGGGNHFIEVDRDDEELNHREFLAEAGKDPRRAIAEALCRDIPKDVCVTAYNKSFECGRLKYLAEAYPDLAGHLLNIRENVVDLLVPFQSGWYYNPAMGGSFSIKSVLPALFPDDPELDYHNLEDIHNGSEAMNAFPAMEHMEPVELERTRKNLLKYCELDTLAMVKIWERLKEVSEE